MNSPTKRRNDDKKTMDDLAKLQMALDELTATASEGTSKKEKEPVRARRRLIRIACPPLEDSLPSPSSPSLSPSLSPSSPLVSLPFTVRGGAANASLIVIDIVRDEQLTGLIMPGEILLTVEGVAVSGMTVSEVTRLIEKNALQKEMMAVEVTASGSLPDDLCEILADKSYAELQTVIRDNVYSKTVPYTTRPPREGEVDGEHYRFVDMNHFQSLLDQGKLLEHGAYEAADVDTSSRNPTSTSPKDSARSRPSLDYGFLYPNRRHQNNESAAQQGKGHLYGTPRPSEEDVSEMVMGGTKMGPLPPNWEVAYADNGEKYFIDHNTGTTQWNDPRELPPGWEQVDDPVYGTFYVDHLNKQTTYERPVYNATRVANVEKGGAMRNGHGGGHHSYPDGVRKSSSGVFTRKVEELRGELLSCRIVKGAKGLGFTLIGNDASSKGDEFIQVKSILPHGSAAADGVLQPGDVLVSVNGHNLLGASQADACHIFVSCPVGEPVDIVVCRGYPLMLDPSNRIITENVYSSASTMNHRSGDVVAIDIVKGVDGFGFTIADSINGQRVKKVIYPAQCPHLLEGDVIIELDGRDVRSIGHQQLVDTLREYPIGHRGRLLVRRSSPKQNRSRTPTAAFRYGEQRSTPAPSLGPRSKTPAPSSRNQSETMYGMNGGNGHYTRQSSTLTRRKPDLPPSSSSARIRPSSTTLGFATTPTYMPISAFRTTNDLIVVNLIRKPQGFGFRLLGGTETGTMLTVGQIVPGGAAADDGRLMEGDEIVEIDGRRVEGASHSEAVSLLEQAAHVKHVKLVVRRIRHNEAVSPASFTRSLHLGSSRPTVLGTNERDVILHRTEGEGFGFIIISSINRDGATIGQIVSGSPAARSGLLQVGDRVVAVNGTEIATLSHGEIVSLIKASGLSVRLTIADPDEPVTTFTATLQHTTPTPSHSHQQLYSNGGPSLETNELRGGNIINVELQRGGKGFGFSIRGGQEFENMPLFVLRIAEDGPAARDGRLRVGDQLVSINGRDTKGLTHEEAITLIKMYPSVRLVVRRISLP